MSLQVEREKSKDQTRHAFFDSLYSLGTELQRKNPARSHYLVTTFTFVCFKFQTAVQHLNPMIKLSFHQQKKH